MSDVTIIPRKNYKSDFALKLTPKEVSGQSVTELPEGDFSLIFRSGGKSYTCSRKDGTYTNCVLNEDGTLTCVFDNHGLMPGVLSVECSFETANELYADGSQKEVSWVRPAGVELVTGNGDEATSFDIDLVMPFAIVTAYQMAVKYGYEGTEEDFYKALAGGSSLELGETAGTAYEGSKGKANADAIAAVKVDLATVQSTANAAKTTAEAASTEISSHEENTTNPHKVTAAQTGAYTKAEADAAMSDKVSGLAKSADVTAALAKKVDAVSGKGLSTNDYTTAEKTKLAGIAEGATKVAVDSALSSSSSNAVANNAVYAAVAAKQDKLTAGSNITIKNNVISATGGGSGGSGVTSYEWFPFADLERWDITAVDHTAGTVTLSTENHGLAAGDKVAIVVTVEIPTKWYKYNNSFYWHAEKNTWKNFPMTQYSAVKVFAVDSVDGAVITSSSLVVSSASYTYTEGCFQLQRYSGEDKYLTLPEGLAGEPLNIRIESEYLNSRNNWSFLRTQTIPLTAAKKSVYPRGAVNGDGVVGLPFVLVDLQCTAKLFQSHDYGIQLFSETVTLQSTGSYKIIDVPCDVDISTLAVICCPNCLGHYATRFLIQRL